MINSLNKTDDFIKMINLPVNPLPGVETNDDWVVWLTVVLVKLISETQFCCVSHSWLAFI